MKPLRCLCTLALLYFATGLQAQDATEIYLGPESLRQWYKPENKRNVWQHNMFKLRRELQAIQHYADDKKWNLVENWTNNFVKHYQKIGDMVPEWKDELDLEASSNLALAAQNSDKQSLQKELRTLRKTCTSCHSDFRSVSALIYRAPDFSKHEITDEQNNTHSYQKYMKELIFELNAVLIANADKRYDDAVENLESLRSGIVQLGESCSVCHKDSAEAREYYLGKKTSSLLDTIQQNLKDRNNKDTGQNIGALAVHTCAKCHATHRIAADMRSLFGD